MEIFVPDDGLDQIVICIRGRVFVRQDIFGIEDVQAFVLHSTHVEVVDRDQVENVQIVLSCGVTGRGLGQVRLRVRVRVRVKVRGWGWG